MNIIWADLVWVTFVSLVLIMVILWVEHKEAIRLAMGSVHTWFYWFLDNVGNPPFCEYVKMRMVCYFCPYEIREKESNTIKVYCGKVKVVDEYGVEVDT